MSLWKLQADYDAARRDYDAALARLSAAKRALNAFLDAEEDERKARQRVADLAVLRAYVDGAKVKDLLVLMGRKGSSISPIHSLADRLFREIVPRERQFDEEFDSKYEGNTVVRSFEEVYKNEARAVLEHSRATQP